MKKQYIQPATYLVKLNINDSVMDAPIVNNSHLVSDESLGKQDDFSMDDDSFTPDLWGDEEEEDY